MTEIQPYVSLKSASAEGIRPVHGRHRRRVVLLRRGHEVMKYGHKIKAAAIGKAEPAPLDDRSYPGVDVWPALPNLPEGLPAHTDIEIAKLFLAEPFERAVLRVLELAGRAFHADRSWTVEYNESLSTFRDTNEWCLDGIATHNIDNLEIPSTALGEMHRLMRDGHPAAIYDVAEMPRSMRALQTKLQLQDTVSSVGIPIHFGGELRGIMGVDMTHARRRWNVQEILQLCRLADLLGHARYGDRDSVDVGAPMAPQDEHIYFQGVRGIVGANIDDIAGCGAEGDSTRILLVGGGEVLDNRGLKWWESVLPESRFIRVHRSAMLKLGAVRELRRRSTGQWVAFVEGHETPLSVSRNKVVLLRNRLGY